jgi:hypothetical protein
MDPRIQLGDVKRTWKPPVELERSWPREVLLTGAGRVLLSIAIILALAAPLAGTLLYVKAVTQREQRRVLLEEGMTAQAVVTRRWKSGREEIHYWLEYLYQAGEQSYRRRIEVGRNSWNRLEAGATLQIRYLPSDPRSHLVLGREDAMIPQWLPFLAAIASGAGAWLITRPVASQHRLLSEGRPVPAVVTGFKQVKHAKILRYSFATLAGEIVTGETSPQRKPQAVGEILCVLYEPDRARHNSVYPFALVRAADLAASSDNPAGRRSDPERIVGIHRFTEKLPGPAE